MALKVKAVERKIKFSKNENDPGVYRYVIGLGTMRFGLRAKSVEKVEDVKTGLISSRRIIFTPTQDLKDELADTAIQITCYDRNGEIVKRVTSADAGTVEDPEGDSSSTGSETAGGGSSSTGSETAGGDPQNPGDGDDGLDQD